MRTNVLQSRYTSGSRASHRHHVLTHISRCLCGTFHWRCLVGSLPPARYGTCASGGRRYTYAPWRTTPVTQLIWHSREDQAYGYTTGCPVAKCNRRLLNEEAVAACLREDEGLFIAAIQRRSRGKHITIKWYEHDLLAEIRGQPIHLQGKKE